MISQISRNFLYFEIFVFLLHIISQTNGQGRLIHGKFFGKLLNEKLIPDRKLPKDTQNYWLTQPVDHFNFKDIRNWQQRYFKNNSFYEDNGPICIMVGGESSASFAWVYRGEMVEQCSKLKGALYMLEHRYYGQSRPLGDASVKNLKYLTISQALADLAKFIRFIRPEDNLKFGKVVLYGGSYSATLVAYFRQKYNYVATAALASSAPIGWKYDFEEYNEVVGRVINTTSETCYNTIKNGINHLDRILSNLNSTNSSEVAEQVIPLKLCSELNTSNELDVQNLFGMFAGSMSYFVQYNNVIKFGIKDVCNFTDSLPSNLSDYEKFAITLNAANKAFGSDCFNFNNTATCEYLAAESWDSEGVSSGARMWMWQVCTEVASFQTSTSPSQPFRNIPPSLYVSQCQCAFGEKYNEATIKKGLARHLAKFGAFKAFRKNVIFTNGENDPWAALGVTDSGKLPTSSRFNLVYLIEGASHCNDIEPATKNDSNSLKDARVQTETYIKKYLGLGDRENTTSTGCDDHCDNCEDCEEYVALED